MINDAGASKESLILKSLESMERVANGQATKIIIPSEIQSVASLLASANELVGDKK